MDQNSLNNPIQHWRLSPGLGIIIVVLGLIGVIYVGPWDIPRFIREACFLIAMSPVIIFLGQTINVLMDRQNNPPVDTPRKLVKRSIWRIQYGLGTLMLIVTMTAIFLGLNISNRTCLISEVGAYSCGFPIPCLSILYMIHTIYSVDWIYAFVDMAIWIVLTIGIALELKRFSNRHIIKDAENTLDNDSSPDGSNPENTN
jgi:hypothetical protein